MGKKILGGLTVLLVLFLIAIGSGGGMAPGGGPGGPGGGGPGGGAGGAGDGGGGPQVVPGKPFNFSGVVKLVNLDGQYFLLADGPIRNPKDLENGAIELINVKPFEYEGKMLYPVILKSTATGLQEISIEEIKPYQSVSAGGIVVGAAEGDPQWELNAAQVHITQNHYLQNKEQTNGFTVIVTGKNGDWLTTDKNLLDNQRLVKMIPGCEIVSQNNQGRFVPYQGDLAGKRVTIWVSKRADIDFLYTSRIQVMGSQ